MSDLVSRGFGGRRRADPDLAARVPPGQYVERGFPVLTAGPTPRVDPDALLDAVEPPALLLDAGLARAWIRTECFGPTG